MTYDDKRGLWSVAVVLAILVVIAMGGVPGVWDAIS